MIELRQSLAGATRSRAQDAAAAVKHAAKILAEAGKAFNDRTRTLRDSKIPELFGAAVGVGVSVQAVGYLVTTAAIVGDFTGTVVIAGAGSATGAAIFTAGLTSLGALVGGGVAAGIGVAAAPAVVLGGGGYWIVHKIRTSHAHKQHEASLHEAIRKREVPEKSRIGHGLRTYKLMICLLKTTRLRDVANLQAAKLGFPRRRMC